jgi:hypothetical protein
MELEGLKFKIRDFYFINRKEMDIFFNKALIDSPFKFIRLTNQMLEEKIHVNFSWMILMKFFSFSLLVPPFIGYFYEASQLFGFFFIGSSVFCFFTYKYFHIKVNNLLIGKSFFNLMAKNDLSSLEEVREELINNQ